MSSITGYDFGNSAQTITNSSPETDLYLDLEGRVTQAEEDIITNAGGVAGNAADVADLQQITTGITYASVGDTTTIGNNVTISGVLSAPIITTINATNVTQTTDITALQQITTGITYASVGDTTTIANNVTISGVLSAPIITTINSTNASQDTSIAALQQVTTGITYNSGTDLTTVDNNLTVTGTLSAPIITTHTSQIAAIQTVDGLQTTLINTNTATNYAQDSRLDAIEAVNTSQASTLTSHTTTLSTHTSQISSLQADIAALQAAVAKKPAHCTVTCISGVYDIINSFHGFRTFPGTSDYVDKLGTGDFALLTDQTTCYINTTSTFRCVAMGYQTESSSDPNPGYTVLCHNYASEPVVVSGVIIGFKLYFVCSRAANPNTKYDPRLLDVIIVHDH